MIARWLSFSLVLFKIYYSHQYAINSDIEHYEQPSFQNNGPADVAVLPQDCIEVCNDYDCLVLCPQPARAVKRCTALTESNKSSCNKEPPTSDSIRTAGKWLWQQAREQYLGIKKDLESDILNRRNAIFKILQPIVNRQTNYYKGVHFAPLLQKTEPKNGKSKLNVGRPTCTSNINNKIEPSLSKKTRINAPAVDSMKNTNTHMNTQLMFLDETKNKTNKYFKDSTISDRRNASEIISDIQKSTGEELAKLELQRTKPVPALSFILGDFESQQLSSNISNEKSKSDSTGKPEITSSYLKETVNSESFEIGDVEKLPSFRKTLNSGNNNSSSSNKHYVGLFNLPSTLSSNDSHYKYNADTVLNEDGSINDYSTEDVLKSNDENESIIHSLPSNLENEVSSLKIENQMASNDTEDKPAHRLYTTPLPIFKDLYNNIPEAAALRAVENDEPVASTGTNAAHCASAVDTMPTDPQVIENDPKETNEVGLLNESITTLQGGESDYDFAKEHSLHSSKVDETVPQVIKSDKLPFQMTKAPLNIETPKINLADEEIFKISSFDYDGHGDKITGSGILTRNNIIPTACYESSEYKEEERSPYSTNDRNLPSQTSDRALQYTGIEQSPLRGVKTDLGVVTLRENLMQVVPVEGSTSNHRELQHKINVPENLAALISSTTPAHSQMLTEKGENDNPPYEVPSVSSLFHQMIDGNLPQCTSTGTYGLPSFKLKTSAVTKTPMGNLVSLDKSSSSDKNGLKISLPGKPEENYFYALQDNAAVGYINENITLVIPMALNGRNINSENITHKEGKEEEVSTENVSYLYTPESGEVGQYIESGEVGQYIESGELGQYIESGEVGQYIESGEVGQYIESEGLPFQRLRNSLNSIISRDKDIHLLNKSFHYDEHEMLVPEIINKKGVDIPKDNSVGGDETKEFYENKDHLSFESDNKEEFNGRINGLKTNNKELANILYKNNYKFENNVEIFPINITNENSLEKYPINQTDYGTNYEPLADKKSNSCNLLNVFSDKAKNTVEEFEDEHGNYSSYNEKNYYIQNESIQQTDNIQQPPGMMIPLPVNNDTNDLKNSDVGLWNYDIVSGDDKSPLDNRARDLETKGFQEISNQSEILKNPYYFKLEKSKASVNENIEDSSNEHEEMLKNPVVNSSKLNHSETLTGLEDDLNTNIAVEKNLNDIIHNEINKTKQHNILLKKREEGMSSEYTECDCGNPIGRNNELHGEQHDVSVVDDPNHNVKFPFNPLMIIFAGPYFVNNCGNETVLNDFIENNMDFGGAYGLNGGEYALPYPVHSNMNDVEEMIQVTPDIPNLYAANEPKIPTIGPYNVFDPNELITDDEMTDKPNLKTPGEQPPEIPISTIGYDEATQDSIILEMYQELPPKSNAPASERFSRSDKEPVDYDFIEGQFVKILQSKMGAEDEESTPEKEDTTPEPQDPQEATADILGRTMEQSDDDDDPDPEPDEKPVPRLPPPSASVFSVVPAYLFFGGRQYAFANRNQTDLSKPGAFFLGIEQSHRKKLLTDDTYRSVYPGKSTNLHGKSTKEYDSSWPPFADLLNLVNNTKIHHYKHHRKHRWWLHEKMKSKVRLKTTDMTKVQEDRIQNFVFRKEKVNDNPILVISEKKQNKEEKQERENQVPTEYTPRKIRHEA